MNKKIYKAILINLMILGTAQLYGQRYPVDANAILIPPYSLTLSDYAVERSQDLMIDVTLNDPIETSLDVRFRITISNNGTDILQTSPNFSPTVITLYQFSTLSLNGFDLAEYFNFNNLVAINGYQYTGLLPEGLNSICVEVVAYNRPDVTVSRRACASGYAVLNDPPYPQLPICGETVETMGSQNIMFTWLPMHLGSPNSVGSVQYQFTLVKVEEGYNPFEALESATPVFQDVTSNISLILQDPLLEVGYDYAWRVRAYDPFDASAVNLFKNNGYSQVCTFTYEEYEAPDLSELYASQDGTGSCSASCQADIPTNSSLISDLSPNDVISVGNFLMNVTEVNSQSGDFFTGKGYVFIPFLLSNMNVTFTDLAVNTDYEFFSGEIVTDIDTDLVSDNMSSESEELSVTATQVEALDDYISTNSRTVSDTEEGSSLGLPFAIDKTIGSINYNIIITGINFGVDEASLNAVMSIKDPESGNGVVFGSKGLCFHPYGIGGGTASLYLFEDFSLGDYSEFDLTFKAPGDENDGTYVNFDCEGFIELNVEGEYAFPDDVLVAADGSGDQVTATFNFNTSEWGQFIASIEMDEFEVYGVDGYSFLIEKAYLDYSDDGNPEEIEFPDGYENSDDDWKGFYLTTSSLTLPEDFAQASGDISLGVENVIIDRSGVTATVFANEILSLNNGRLGDWAFSIDTVQLAIESNTLVEGALLGQMHVPILDEENSLVYSGLMTKTDDGIDILFTIETEEDVNVSMWAAEMSLSSSSVIAIQKTSDGFTPYAELHGGISINSADVGGPDFSIDALGFEGLKINHPDEDSRIALDAFSLLGQTFTQSGSDSSSSDDDSSQDEEEESETESLSGFPISIGDIAFEDGEGDEAGISFSLGVNLTGDDMGLSSSADLTLTGAYNASGAPFNAWSFDGISLSALSVEGELPGVSIQGSVEIYEEDETFGDGFKGILGAEFTGIGKLNALAQFGSVDGYRYFFVDTYYLNANAPIIDILGVGLYGFGGGAFYHMSRVGATEPSLVMEDDTSIGVSREDPTELGVSLSGVAYEPDESTLFGIKAGLTMGIAPGKTMSADLTLEATFGVAGNGAPTINTLSLDGDMYFMSPGDLTDRDESSVIGSFSATLNFTTTPPILHGNASVVFNNDIITGGGNAEIHLEEGNSYAYIGTPDDRIEVTVADLATFNFYADMGSTVPDMPTPKSVMSDMGYSGFSVDEDEDNSDSYNFTYSNGTNILAGASFSLGTAGFKYDPFYARAAFGMGFDTYIGKVSSDCKSGEIGIDGWYMKANAYAFAQAALGIHVDVWFYEGDVDIFDFNGYMILKAELPNPIWMEGEVHADYRILAGAIKGSVDYKFQVGEQCETYDEVGVDLSGLKIISDMSPEDGNEDVSVLLNPAAAFNFPLEEEITLEVVENGETNQLYFKPVLKSISLTGGTSNYETEIDPDGESLVLRLIEMLDPETNYTYEIIVDWQEKINGSWTSFTTETKTISFKTGSRPLVLTADFIEFTWPLSNARNVLTSGVNSVEIWARTESWDYLTDQEGFEYYLTIQCVDDKEVKGYWIINDYWRGNRTKVKNGYTGWYIKDNNFYGLWFSNHKGHVQKVTLAGFPDGVSPWQGNWQNASTLSSTTNADGITSANNQLNDSNNSGTYLDIYSFYFRVSDYSDISEKLDDIALDHSLKFIDIPYSQPYQTDGRYNIYWNDNMGIFNYDHSRWKLLSSYEAFDQYERGGFSSPTGLVEVDPLFYAKEWESWDQSESGKLQDYQEMWDELEDTYSYLEEELGNWYYTIHSSTARTNYYNEFLALGYKIFDGDVPRYTTQHGHEIWYHYRSKSLLSASEQLNGNASNGMYSTYSQKRSICFRSGSEWTLNAIKNTIWNGAYKATNHYPFKDAMYDYWTSSKTLDGAKFTIGIGPPEWGWYKELTVE